MKENEEGWGQFTCFFNTPHLVKNSFLQKFESKKYFLKKKLKENKVGTIKGGKQPSI